MSILGLIIGYIGLIFFYYLFTFINWLNSNWDNIFTKLITVIVFTALFSFVAGATFLLRKWIDAQLMLQKTKNNLQLNSVAIPVKGAQYGFFLAMLLLAESAFSSYTTINTIHLIATEKFPEEFSHLAPGPFSLLVMIVQIVLVVIGAIALLQQKASAVLFLGAVLIINLAGICYQLFLNVFYFMVALIYVTLIRGLPFAYVVFLLRNDKLS